MMDAVTFRAALTSWQYYALEIQFLLFVACSVVCIPTVVRQLAPPRAAVAAALAAALLALSVIALSVPRTNRIFYDEQIYEGIAQNLSDLSRAQMCNDGTVEYGRLHCTRGEYNKQPYGYPYIVSVAYRAFGVHENIAHTLNTLMAVVFVLAVFLTTGALAGDWRAAAFAALAAAIVPEHLIWSNTAAVEPSAAAMLSLTLLAAVWFTRVRTHVSLVWMIATTAFAMQFRIESALIVPVVLLVLVLYAPDALRRRSFWLGVLGGVLLSAVHGAHLVAVSNESWGAPAERMALTFVTQNMLPNALYYVDNTRFPLLVSVCAAVGVFVRRDRAVLVPAVAFGVFWSVYLFFYAGSYEYGADVRYALMSHGPLAMLAGCGVSWMLSTWTRHVRNPRYASAAVVAAFAFQLLLLMPHVRSIGEGAWAARADVQFADRMATRIGPRGMVLTHNPSVFLVRGVNAAQLSMALTDEAYVTNALLSRFAAGVFIHWNFWCNTDDKVHVAVCSDALARFPHELVEEYRERDQRFAFYRILPGKPANEGLPLRLLQRDR
jgi:hypothetical protein